MLFRELSEYFDKLNELSSRLSMIDVLAELFSKAGKEEVQKIIYITQGVLAPPFEGVEFGMAEKNVAEAIAAATGFTKEEVEKAHRKAGDMGLAAEEMQSKTRMRRMASGSYSVLDVYNTMLKIARMSGQGSKDMKIKALASLLAAMSAREARYAVKYMLDELRLGVGDATVLEALSVACTGDRKFKDDLEKAYNLCSDLGLVGETIKKEGKEAIRDFRVTPFKPIRPALAERLPTAEEILEKMGGKCSVEQKYDGFRCQIHRVGKRVEIYSRRLENTTSMYPDLVHAVLHEISAESFIMDGEALAYNSDSKEFLPFQETIQRKRKHGVEEKAAEMPLKLFAFDLMYLDGKNCMNLPYHERRALIERITKGSATILQSGSILATTPKQLEDFFQETVEEGLEGIVAKDLDSKYVAGARKFAWIKMKRSYKGELSDTLDLVILGYFLGHGTRSEFKFGGLLCATYNHKRDMFETISRVGSGFTEEQMRELKSKLDKIRVDRKPSRVDAVVEPDFWVYPKYVVTIKADEITKSPSHTCGRGEGKGEESGYALRFPRLVAEGEAIRADKSVEEATTTEEVVEMYRRQKKVSIASAGQ